MKAGISFEKKLIIMLPGLATLFSGTLIEKIFRKIVGEGKNNLKAR